MKASFFIKLHEYRPQIINHVLQISDMKFKHKTKLYKTLWQVWY